MVTLIVNKNRGWRGLSEAKLLNEEGEIIQTMIFSFSQAVWDDMLQGLLVMQDEKNYIVLHFGDIDNLPHPTQQRSVLIKDAKLRVAYKKIYLKSEWAHKTTPEDYSAICNFIANKNNHTTSDFNCIGIRVVPLI